MAFTPEEILQTINKGGGPSRTNKYTIRITPPDAMSREFKRYAQELEFLCEAMEIPGRIFPVKAFSTYGQEYKFPTGDVNTSDLNLTFICTNSMRELEFFEAWQSLVINPDTWDVGLHNDFVGTIDINIFAEYNKDNPTYTFKVTNAWPTTRTQLAYSWAQGSEYQKLAVTFSWR